MSDELQPRDAMDIACAEFVLGTLRGEARVAFEKKMQSDAHLRERVVFWQEAFSVAVLELAPSEPSARTWDAIERAAFSSSENSAAQAKKFSWRGLFPESGWKWATSALAALSVVLLVVTVQTQSRLSSQAVQCYVVLSDAQNNPRVVVIDGDNMRELTVMPVGDSLRDATKSLSLWIETAETASQLDGLARDRHSKLVLTKNQTSLLMKPNAQLVIRASEPGDVEKGSVVYRGAIALLPPKTY
jgi:anti-sigma-K factor RskA